MYLPNCMTSHNKTVISVLVAVKTSNFSDYLILVTMKHEIHSTFHIPQSVEELQHTSNLNLVSVSSRGVRKSRLKMSAYIRPAKPAQSFTDNPFDSQKSSSWIGSLCRTWDG